jgi:hypothetical protein
MPSYCPKCLEPDDFLHKCDSGKAAESEWGSKWVSEGSSGGIRTVPLTSLIISAPFMGVVLDQFIALPSSLIHSLLLTLIGSGLIAITWVAINHKGRKSFRFYWRNSLNFLYTPNILKIFSASDSRRTTSLWFGAVAISMTLQIFLFTSGNSTYLESRITKQIDDASGAELEVACPSNQLYFYTGTISCKVKTGILWIKVPARVELSPIFGTSKIKVSLL